MLSESADRWFRMLVGSNKASRTKDFQSNDFFQALLQIQEKHGYDDTYLAGHAMALYLDGTESSSIVMSYALYELARNPQCQQRMYDEVKAVLAKYNGEITYDAVQEMQYTEWVMLETIRMHPHVFNMAKKCTKPYKMPKTTQQTEPITIAPGTIIQIPTFGMYM